MFAGDFDTDDWRRYLSRLALPSSAGYHLLRSQPGQSNRQGLFFLLLPIECFQIVSDGSNAFKLANMTISRIKGENLQTIFDETYDNHLEDVYQGKERPKAQAGKTALLRFRNHRFV